MSISSVGGSSTLAAAQQLAAKAQNPQEAQEQLDTRAAQNRQSVDDVVSATDQTGPIRSASTTRGTLVDTYL